MGLSMMTIVLVPCNSVSLCHHLAPLPFLYLAYVFEYQSTTPNIKRDPLRSVHHKPPGGSILCSKSIHKVKVEGCWFELTGTVSQLNFVKQVL